MNQRNHLHLRVNEQKCIYGILICFTNRLRKIHIYNTERLFQAQKFDRHSMMIMLYYDEGVRTLPFLKFFN